MGVIRFLLATCVVINHMPFAAPHFFDSELAVRAFFVISGFYMTLILNEKYSSYGVFLTNRLLRLYPIYLTVLIITFIIVLFKHDFIYQAYWHILNIPSFTFVALVNIFILGQDVAMFMGVNVFNGTLFLTENFYKADSPLYQYLLIPQAWSISIELMFYLVAPFIVKRNSGWIVLIIIAGTLFRLTMSANGFNHDPWTYRFFPFEIVIFCLGVLSYKIYKHTKDIKSNRLITGILYFFMLAYTLGFKHIPATFLKESFVLYPLILMITIPFIFTSFKSNKWDRYIGDLSYPIYICHMLIISLIYHYVMPHLNDFGKTLAWPLTLGATIIFSMILLKFVSNPIEQYRQSRVKSL